ncbi:endonuclease/exonuclease/phosphatase family protein [uncultured Friedmanniella sp.]|uniref:endonuclease/exonuclease/phosphatase family protein n=1 Tax=uncultured Friedmanniella sp. TaxID=335381 RepID=UPI0035CC5D12
MRLATFNILHGRSLHDGTVDPDRLAEAVRRLDPDVLALQEVDRDQPRSHLADLTAVAAEAMGALSYRFAAALVGTPGRAWTAAGEDDLPGEAAYGIALLSRYPVTSWRVAQLPRIPFAFPYYRSQQRRVVRMVEEPRAVVTAHLDTPDGPLVVVSTHLSYVPGWGRTQLRQIRRSLVAVADPVVLMGDLNLAGAAPARVTGFRPLAAHPTFPLGAPDRQIDHILARGPVGAVIGSAAPDLGLSDHRALVVELAPRAAR